MKKWKLSLTISDIDIVYFSSYKKNIQEKYKQNSIFFNWKKINLLLNIDPKTYKSKFELLNSNINF